MQTRRQLWIPLLIGAMLLGSMLTQYLVEASWDLWLSLALLACALLLLPLQTAVRRKALLETRKGQVPGVRSEVATNANPASLAALIIFVAAGWGLVAWLFYLGVTGDSTVIGLAIILVLGVGVFTGVLIWAWSKRHDEST